MIDWLVDQLTDSPMVHSIQRKIFHLIITFSSSKSWSSCMLDAPEKSQPNRFWNKKNEKARTMIVKWLYNLLSLALYFPNIGKSTKIGNWACCKRGTKKKILIPRQHSNLWSPEHRAGVLSDELWRDLITLVTCWLSHIHFPSLKFTIFFFQRVSRFSSLLLSNSRSLFFVHVVNRSRISSVGTALDCRAEDRVIRFLK